MVGGGPDVGLAGGRVVRLCSEGARAGLAFAGGFVGEAGGAGVDKRGVVMTKFVGVDEDGRGV